MRPWRTLDGCKYDGEGVDAVGKLTERTDSTSLRLSALKMSNWPCTRPFPTWNHLARLRSTWFTRSAYSVPGARNGTFSVAALMLGITSAPGVHGPVQSAAYRVVGLIDQTVPIPGGVIRFGSAVGRSEERRVGKECGWRGGAVCE